MLVPTDLQTELDKNENLEIKKYFDNLPNSHKLEYIKWIESAKKPETKITRIKKTIEMLKEKN